MLRKYKKIQQKTCQYDKKIVNLDIRGKKSRKRKGDFMKKLWNNKNTKDIFAFCEEYKDFLSNNKRA